MRKTYLKSMKFILLMYSQKSIKKNCLETRDVHNFDLLTYTFHSPHRTSFVRYKIS